MIDVLDTDTLILGERDGGAHGVVAASERLEECSDERLIDRSDRPLLPPAREDP